MDYLPLFHDLRGRPCLVVGGGEIALRKLRPLVEAGGRVVVVAPEICAAIREFARACEGPADVRLEERSFSGGDLRGMALVIAATNEAGVNETVSRLARESNIPVNVVDNPALCSVIFPAIVDRSPVQIAIGTGGAAPVLARLLRGRIESMIPAAYGRLAKLAERFRPEVKKAIASEAGRRRFWERVFEGAVAESVFKGNDREAEKLLGQSLTRPEDDSQGEVYLVGAGPGDPDLLTFRALRLMQQADIVLYDRLVSREVLDMVRRDAERLYVGKRAGNHPVSQENINRKLVELALAGRRVLRLKGGDPFIFGRGGEEIAHLADNGIPFQVVPGITAASGCASYAGIPLTHRDHAKSVMFVTGHRHNDKLDIDWPRLVAPEQTLVFYMGLNNVEIISRELIGHGMAPSMPAALVEKGTTTSQRVVIGTIADLPGKVKSSAVGAPTLIIVGGVVTLHKTLNWFASDVYE